MSDNLDKRDVPPVAAFCYLGLTAAVTYATQVGAPPEAYWAFAAIAAAIAAWAGRPLRWRNPTGPSQE